MNSSALCDHSTVLRRPTLFLRVAAAGGICVCCCLRYKNCIYHGRKVYFKKIPRRVKKKCTPEPCFVNMVYSNLFSSLLQGFGSLSSLQSLPSPSEPSSSPTAPSLLVTNDYYL